MDDTKAIPDLVVVKHGKVRLPSQNPASSGESWLTTKSYFSRSTRW